MSTGGVFGQKDWLLNAGEWRAQVYKGGNGKDLVIENGLVRRVFRLAPNLACVDYVNLGSGQQLLRAVKPEASVEIDGRNYFVGGLYGQTENAYLQADSIDRYEKHAEDLQYTGYSTGELLPRLVWKPRGWALQERASTGRSVVLDFASSDPVLKGISVQVHYNIYDGIPLLEKWVSVENKTRRRVELGRVVNEILAVVEEESAVVGSTSAMEKQHGLYIEANYAFNNSMRYDLSDQTSHWKADKAYTSQVNYDYQTPCLLEVYPEKVGRVALGPSQTFESVRSYELLMDSYDRERRGLAIRRMYRVIAPWTTENPIFMHLVSQRDEEVTHAIDQCAATGYEALILSFGSHCDMEDSSAANIRKWKGLADYAHRKGIRIGGYSLFSSRRIDDANDVIDPVTGKADAGAFFGHAPCMGSRWGLAYLATLKRFISGTGFDLFENDGPYPGDVCASTAHPGHEGLWDSQWKQMALQKELYQWCNARGVYVNAPDWYFLDGTNKIALGYREVNFSLPRADQKILNRQNIYDGLWEKTASMSWGFVPLTKYQGGGPEAVLEPLSEHLRDYEQLMMQYYGAGVQACYRGPRLYDTEPTRVMVASVVDWYKRYRVILNSDIIHLRRADGRDWDGILHVQPGPGVKGLAMLYNPLREPIRRTVRLPLYYTGLSAKAMVREREGKAVEYTLDRDHGIEVEVSIPADGYTWLVIE